MIMDQGGRNTGSNVSPGLGETAVIRFRSVPGLIFGGRFFSCNHDGPGWRICKPRFDTQRFLLLAVLIDPGKREKYDRGELDHNKEPIVSRSL